MHEEVKAINFFVLIFKRNKDKEGSWVDAFTTSWKIKWKLRRLKEGKHFSPQSEVKITYDKSNVPPKPLRELDYGDGKKSSSYSGLALKLWCLGRKLLLTSF